MADSPFQHKWRAILLAAKDLPRHGKPTIVTTSGARSGHGVVDTLIPIPFDIKSEKKEKKNVFLLSNRVTMLYPLSSYLCILYMIYKWNRLEFEGQLYTLCAIKTINIKRNILYWKFTWIACWCGRCVAAGFCTFALFYEANHFVHHHNNNNDNGSRKNSNNNK